MMTGADEVSQTAAHPRPFRERPDHLQLKVWVVYQRVFRKASRSRTQNERPNIRVIAVKLSRGAAEAVVDAIPGTWFERFYADKKKLGALCTGLHTPAAEKGSSNGD